MNAELSPQTESPAGCNRTGALTINSQRKYTELSETLQAPSEHAKGGQAEGGAP